MSPVADLMLKRWAVWQLAPIPGHSLGYGRNILDRVMEGQGAILPGPPRCSGPVKIHTDAVAGQVEDFLRQQPPEFRKLAQVFYLRQDLTAGERSVELKLAIRTMYRRLDMLHERLLDKVA